MSLVQIGQGERTNSCKSTFDRRSNKQSKNKDRASVSKINLIFLWIQSVDGAGHNHKQVEDLPRKSDSASLSKIDLTIPLE